MLRVFKNIGLTILIIVIGVIVISLVITILPFIIALDITFSVDQEEYFFLVGEESQITLQMNNTYGKDISGTLTHTIVQSTNQGGLSYSNTNSQTQSFTVKKGESDLLMSFGKSDSILDLNVELFH